MAPRLPRIFLLRHGETEWSLSGQHTGTTDIPLTANGERIVRALGPRVVGEGKLLDPSHIQQVFVSPRVRAQRTLELLFEGNKMPPTKIEEGVQEWNYGDYEGRTAGDIREKSDPKWDIWVDGCPNGESAAQVSDRCDAMIAKIVEIHSGHHGDVEKEGYGDVLIVSHGHFTRCFLTKWCKLNLSQGRIFVCDAGALSIGGYQHSSFDERSLLGVNLFGEI